MAESLNRFVCYTLEPRCLFLAIITPLCCCALFESKNIAAKLTSLGTSFSISRRGRGWPCIRGWWRKKRLPMLIELGETRERLREMKYWLLYSSQCCLPRLVYKWRGFCWWRPVWERSRIVSCRTRGEGLLLRGDSWTWSWLRCCPSFLQTISNHCVTVTKLFPSPEIDKRPRSLRYILSSGGSSLGL